MRWERENIGRVRRKESVDYVGQKQRRGNTCGRDVGSREMIGMRSDRRWVLGKEGRGMVDEESKERETGGESTDGGR